MNKDLNDILYDIDMQLYDEFNQKIATMNDYLGDIYSLRDVEEVENAKKEKEIELLRIAVIKQQKEIELNKAKIISDSFHKYVGKKFDKEFISKDKLEAILEKYKHTELGDDEKILKFYKELQSLLEKE